VARGIVAALVSVAAIAVAFFLYGDGHGRDKSVAIVFGFVFGAVLQRSRFCFASAFRDVFLLRDRRAMLGLLVALVVGCVGYQLIYLLWIPSVGEFLPRVAHIGRANWHLVLGGATFGLGMVVAGGCISGNLFRLGEGQTTSPVALIGVLVGYNAAFLVWNSLWVSTVAESREVWLPQWLGYVGAFVLQLGVLAAAAHLLFRLPALPPKPAQPATLAVVHRKVFVEGWPTWVGGVLVGILGTVALLFASPLGVTAEIARVARAMGDGLGLLPDRLQGLDVLRGCSMAETGGISNNGIFVLALVAGSFAAAMGAGEFRLRVGRPRAYAFAFGGGILMGFGAMISIGCTVGTLLSGVMAFALSGWLFAIGLLAGAYGGAWILRRAA
jgi:hypothetical protein